MPEAEKVELETANTQFHHTETPLHSTIPETTSADIDLEKLSIDGKSAEATEKNPDVIDFDKPTDPENPMDWPTSKKTIAIVIVTNMTLLS